MSFRSPPCSWRHTLRPAFFLGSAAFLLACAPVASLAQFTPATKSHYIASWATSVQGADSPASPPAVDPVEMTDVTVRQVVHLSVSGLQARVVLSNAFGTQPLRIDDVHIAQAARPGSAAIVPGTDHLLGFAANGSPSVVIPAGAEYVTSAAVVQAAPGSDLAISFHLREAPVGESTHPGSRATSFLLHGDHAGDTDLPGAEPVVRWFNLAEVELTSSPAGRTVVAFGDSITDGHAAITDGNTRWTDFLAAHLRAAGMTDIGIANEGIGGNHLLTNGIGQSALERMDRDLFSLPAVRDVLVLEGINDLGALSRTPDATPAMHAELVARLEGAYAQIIERGHAHGMRVIGCTLTPWAGSGYYHPGAASEADRQALNAWIRQTGPGHFDAMVDFDKAVRDPAQQDRMLPAYDSGDHLHPGPAGYKVMGDAVPLALLR